MDEFEIQKIQKMKKQSDEQDEKILQLRKRIARAEKNILGYSMETDDDGKER
ncbi:hypothetical protein ES705_05370 [subsurface metagenome]